MKLFFSPGACALGPQIALREAGLKFDLIPVNLKEKTYSGGNFLEVNPKGYVPAILTDAGDLLSEGAVILQYIADQAPAKKLIPQWGHFDRYRAMEWLHYIATEVHKSYGPIFGAAMSKQPIPEAALKTLLSKFTFVNSHLTQNKFLMGAEFSVADAYLFNVLNWAPHFNIDMSEFKGIQAFMDLMMARPSVQESLKGEGLI